MLDSSVMNKEYTVKEAAEIVGVSDSRIRQLALADEVEHKRFGKMLVITEKGIQQAKSRKKTKGPAKQDNRRKVA
jgi:excisionase family DNA binding protein